MARETKKPEDGKTAGEETRGGEIPGGESAGKTGCVVCPIASLAGAGGILHSKLMDVFPAEFVEHAAGARREFLLAIRSLIDEALRSQDAYLERYRNHETEKAARRRGPQKVPVE